MGLYTEYKEEQTMWNSEDQETDTIYGDLVKETEKAYLLDVYNGDNVWVPKSQIENLTELRTQIDAGKTTGLEFELPEWIIKEKNIS